MADMAGEAEPCFDERFFQDFMALLRWRRDVRHFDPRPLPAEELSSILSACDFAPSVGNSQPWRFVQVDDPERRRAIRDNFERCNLDALQSFAGDKARRYACLKLAGLDAAPVQLAVFSAEGTGQGHGLGVATMPEMLRYSAVTAVHTLWLAARCRGIGLGWVSILDPQEVAATLDVPPDWRLVAYLCLGYPLSADAVPELERRGWQARIAGEERVLKR